MSPVIARLAAALADRYRVERELGAGGMATVYLAHDLRHERDVAIKVLHPDLGAVLGADRFLAEIKLTARLQHPHILPLLDSGAADGLLYYVMPYVRGETLRTRLERETQLAIPEAVRMAGEVADALQAAHALGVVHRDIKPENILLQDGHALVADFGIALAVQQAGGQRMTQTGLSLGTPQYMAPEQATGEKVVDARADIYALAAVTYEMLTGAPPFTGANVQAIMARVMTSDAEPPSRVRKTIPPGVEAAVLQGLAKLPADRFASARDFAQALQQKGIGRHATTGAAPRVAPRTRRAMVLGAMGMLVAALGGWGIGRWGGAKGATPTLRQQVVLWHTAVPDIGSPGAEFVSNQVALSPSADLLVFVDSTPRGWTLFGKRREDEDATAFVGTEGARSPFFSPDGQWIGYFGPDGSLYKMPHEGGSIVRVAGGTAQTVYHSAAWLRDNTIAYTDGMTDRVSRITASGTALPPLRLPVEWAGKVTHIEELPGGASLLLVVCQSNCATGMQSFWYDLKRDTLHAVVPDVSGAWYHAASGLLLVTRREGGLFAAAFDPAAGQITGDLQPVIDRVAPGQFAISATGDVVYSLTAAAQATRELVWVDRGGHAVPVDSGWRGWFEYPALAPDGRRLGVSVRDAATVLWLREVDGSRSPVRVAGRLAWRPSWSPDGRRLLFIGADSGVNGPRVVFETDAQGRGQSRAILRPNTTVGEAETCTNGMLAYRTDDVVGGPNLWMRTATDTSAHAVVNGPAMDIQLALSPDCRTIAYTSSESGEANIYLADFPAATVRRLVSRDGGQEARWSKDGRTLYYVGNGTLLQVPMGADPLRTMGTASPLFRLDGYARARNRAQYDVAPDGRFLMIREPPPAPVPPVIYVQNWIPELLAKVKR
jgi:serine/threonine-protein kinase